jgi:hypothetical protein
VGLSVEAGLLDQCLIVVNMRLVGNCEALIDEKTGREALLEGGGLWDEPGVKWNERRNSIQWGEDGRGKKDAKENVPFERRLSG